MVILYQIEERRIMFNKQVLDTWEDYGRKAGNPFAAEVVLALIEHIRLQDKEIEDLIKQVEFYENQTERKSITDDYYS